MTGENEFGVFFASDLTLSYSWAVDAMPKLGNTEFSGLSGRKAVGITGRYLCPPLRL